jgi:hypothetical protein
MTQVIIYNQDNGVPAVLMPTEEALQTLGLAEIALKDVPAGKPFKFVDAAALPSDWPQETWEADLSEPDGTGMGTRAWFIKRWKAEIAGIEAETAPAAPDTLATAPITAFDFPEEATEDERKAAYAQYVAQVDAFNTTQFEAHKLAVEDFEASKAQRIAQLNAQIAAMEKELQELGA